METWNNDHKIHIENKSSGWVKWPSVLSPLVIQPNKLNVISGTHVVEEEKHLPEIVLWPTHTYTINKYNLKIQDQTVAANNRDIQHKVSSVVRNLLFQLAGDPILVIAAAQWHHKELGPFHLSVQAVSVSQLPVCLLQGDDAAGVAGFVFSSNFTERKEGQVSFLQTF